MSHCPLTLLDDVDDVIAEVRGWTSVVEKKPAVFYVRREPFLHFHLLAGDRRCADIQGRDGWLRVDLPHPLPVTTRRRLLRELRARHADWLKPAR